MRWLAVLLGALGGLGGIVTAVEMHVAASDSGDPLPWVFSQAQIRVFLIVIAVLFGVALLAAFLSLKALRISGLTLILSGGVGLVLAFIVVATGGLYFVPSAFLVILGGVLVVSSAANIDARG